MGPMWLNSLSKYKMRDPTPLYHFCQAFVIIHRGALEQATLLKAFEAFFCF
ncbi:UNVERIFIED_CONTAM: hypothetical protein FKN15_026359 [Acipenser sinensis]